MSSSPRCSSLAGASTLVALFLITAPGFGQGGVDRLAQDLRQRTAEALAAADLAWADMKSALLDGSDGNAADNLAALGSAMQFPVLRSLRTELASEVPHASERLAMVDLLARVVDASGADRLAALAPQLGPALQVRLAPVLARRGGEVAQRSLVRSFRHDPASAVGTAALLALTEYGDPSRLGQWTAGLDLAALPEETRREALRQLATRDLPNGFRLPESWFSLNELPELEALVAILAKAPDEEREDFVLGLVLDKNRPKQLRSAALKVAEHGGLELKWRNAKRRLGQILRDKDGDPLAEETAWTLHRLDDKAGRRWLLAEPEEALKRDRASWRAYIALGRRQVDVDEFRDGYKTFRDGIDLAEANRGRLSALDWLYAARAAAGAHRTQEAGDWLAKSRMTPAELSPYKDLPEFAPLLDKEPFHRLFGLR